VDESETAHSKHVVAIRIAVALPIGILSAVTVGITAGWQYAPDAGWIAAVTIYLLWTWLSVTPMSAEDIACLVQQQRPTRGPSDTFVVLASVASLIGVAYLLMAPNVEGPDSTIAATVGFLSVIASWLTVNTVYTLRYAVEYYTDPVGGIEFNQDDKPTFADFAYVAFTVAVTYGVTDTALQNRRIRGTALQHPLVSYLFGAVILAITIQMFGSLTGPPELNAQPLNFMGGGASRW
jgi:uncharacterized membrane protein